MIEFKGKGNITARVVAHSVASCGTEIITYELEYPRFIHSELMTHRMFSRNAASSRAIPVTKMIEVIREQTAMPIHWGKNQPGMQANEECNTRINPSFLDTDCSRDEWWGMARDGAIYYAEEYNKAGYHKQIVNRLLEPFQMMKTIVTATQVDNWFWLRAHEDAQPEIKELAEMMLKCYKKSLPEFLHPGEWHTPYVKHERLEFGVLGYYVDAPDGRKQWLTLADALKVSSSCCAQASYRLLDNSVPKAVGIYDKLVNSEPVHASPFEHQATPMLEREEYYDEYSTNDVEVNIPEVFSSWEQGITHSDRDGNLWSGNLKGWVQHRQLIPNNVCEEFFK